MGASSHYASVDRVQTLLDSENHPTDYVAFCALLTDLAHYAAVKGWDLTEEAGIAVSIVARREAA